MKNYEVKLNLDGANPLVSDVIIQCLEAIPEGGLTIAEQDARIMVSEKITEVAKGKKIELSKPEWGLAAEVLLNTRFPFMNKDFVNMAKEIVELTK